ncbi:hypothetical protein [Corynebacterium hindlerae]|uniref:hypothetical protein n=1 Tax=Corynebacterium hindlerae TaxID=699041 RepID=UPI0031B6E413
MTKKNVLLFTAIAMVALAIGAILSPQSFNFIRYPLAQMKYGIKETDETKALSKAIRKVSPKGTKIHVSESRFGKIATVNIPDGLPKEQRGEFMKEFALLAEQHLTDNDETFISFPLGTTAIHITSEPSQIMTKYKHTEELFAEFGDSFSTYAYYDKTPSLTRELSAKTAEECSSQIKEVTPIVSSSPSTKDGYFVSFKGCADSNASYSSPAEAPNPTLDEFADFVARVGTLPKDSSISMDDRGTLVVHFSQQLSPEQEEIIKSWTNGKSYIFPKR